MPLVVRCLAFLNSTGDVIFGQDTKLFTVESVLIVPRPLPVDTRPDYVPNHLIATPKGTYVPLVTPLPSDLLEPSFANDFNTSTTVLEQEAIPVLGDTSSINDDTIPLESEHESPRYIKIKKVLKPGQIPSLVQYDAILDIPPPNSRQQIRVPHAITPPSQKKSTEMSISSDITMKQLDSALPSLKDRRLRYVQVIVYAQ